MTGRKQRPALETPPTADMSVRDLAAAIGVSTAELCRWKKLAELPEEVFEERLAAACDTPNGKRRRLPSVTELLRGEPVPTRGRVERAIGIYQSMSTRERMQFTFAIAKLGDGHAER